MKCVGSSQQSVDDLNKAGILIKVLRDEITESDAQILLDDGFILNLQRRLEEHDKFLDNSFGVRDGIAVQTDDPSEAARDLHQALIEKNGASNTDQVDQSRQRRL